jgi:cobyrinic acid a,c-diamide synthase
MDRGTGIKEGLDGMISGNTLGSYTHMHAASNIGFTKKFIESCIAYKDDA